jgi:hypothetical protein
VAGLEGQVVALAEKVATYARMLFGDSSERSGRKKSPTPGQGPGQGGAGRATARAWVRTRSRRFVSYARVDETTGDRTPEIVSYTKFALAHWIETLYAATAAALDGSTLGIRSALAHAGKWSAWPRPSHTDEDEGRRS